MGCPNKLVIWILVEFDSACPSGRVVGLLNPDGMPLFALFLSTDSSSEWGATDDFSLLSLFKIIVRTNKGIIISKDIIL